ncbi:hypothetical protein [Xanthomarina sp. F2636L]|uniref:hypothetical protein n=1 Tax=Xanthomarina sp. F2636L TaxID=2996018 RepID=UPI00225E59B7|nr:hypothetical protein [Xanthomarina sp. F2636L]MCX7549268.1 hypothetical protein [Xanthomarina sp. F2636L]
MKKLLFSLLFFVGFSSFAQTYVEKYNSLNGRYEYFDKQTNKMVAYKSYNSLNGTWETTYVNNNQQGSGRYIPQKQRTDDNFALLQQVMAEKQAKFDANYEKIMKHIGSFRMKTVLAIDERKVAGFIMDNFYKNCVNSLDGKNYDLSSNSKTIEIMNYITNCYDQLVYEAKANNKTVKTTATSTQSVSNNEAIINGGYKTNQILEYQYNSKTKKYDLIFDEKISSELIFKADSIYFKRGTDDWKGAKWFYQGFNEDNKQHIFFDDYNQTITFDKNFDTISWYAEPKDKVFQKIYIYKYLTKFDIIYTTN